MEVKGAGLTSAIIKKKKGTANVARTGAGDTAVCWKRDRAEYRGGRITKETRRAQVAQAPEEGTLLTVKSR